MGEVTTVMQNPVQQEAINYALRPSLSNPLSMIKCFIVSYVPNLVEFNNVALITVGPTPL